MKKIILSVVVALSLISPAILILFKSAVIACPVKEPETLLSLYEASDAIHIARFMSSSEGEAKKAGNDTSYQVAAIEKNFDVITTLKGNTVKTVTVHDQRYIYPGDPIGVVPEPMIEEPTEEESETTESKSADTENQEVVAEEKEESVEEVEDGSNGLKPGDEVLLFLNEKEDQGAESEGQAINAKNKDAVAEMELAAYGEGLKILSREEMAVYEERIKELGPIFAAEKPDVERIVDWLVRCAQDPVTRWEGTYELQRSFQASEYKRELEAEHKRKTALGEAGEEGEILGNFLGKVELAEAVNEYHRQTLTNLVLNGNMFTKGITKKTEMERGDAELISLVSRWGDAQIAMALAERLRSNAYSIWENEQLMQSIASILKDKQLDRLAEKYQSIAYSDDDEPVDKQDLLDAGPPEISEKKQPVAGEFEAPPLPETERKPLTDPTAATGEKAEAKPVIKYKAYRIDLMEQFLKRADKVILDPASAGTTAINDN